MPVITRNFGCLTLKMKSLRSLKTSGTTTPPMKLISNKTCAFNLILCAMLNIRATDFFFWWHFDTIPGHGLHLRGFAITVNGHSTLGRTPLNKTSFRRRDLYLITLKAHQETNLHAPSVFEPTIPEIEGTQTHILDRAATGIGSDSGKASEKWKIKTWGQLCFLLNTYRGFLYRKKRSVRLNDYSIPSRVQVKNKWSYNPTPPTPCCAFLKCIEKMILILKVGINFTPSNLSPKFPCPLYSFITIFFLFLYNFFLVLNHTLLCP